MSRSFSTTARALLDITWKNTQAKAEYDAIITRSIQANQKLSKWAEKVEVAGDEHGSKADPHLRVIGANIQQGGNTYYISALVQRWACGVFEEDLQQMTG